MELDEFLEKDIIHYLEERKEKKVNVNIDREEDYGLYLTKDYLKEVTRALDKDEISIAQKLFDELKTHYDTLPKSSLESKKIYTILEQIYSKINAYEQLKGDVKSLKSFNDILGQGFQGSMSQKIHLTTTKIDKKIDNIDEKLTTFGKDVKDLKTTVIETRTTPVLTTSDGQTFILKNSQVKIMPPDSPKDVPKPDKSETDASTEKHLITIIKDKKEKRTDFKHAEKIDEFKDIRSPSFMTSQETKKDIHKESHDESATLRYHQKHEEEKKGMRLYKIPKKGHKKETSKKSSAKEKSEIKNLAQKFIEKNEPVAKKIKEQDFTPPKDVPVQKHASYQKKESWIPEHVSEQRKDSMMFGDTKESFDSPFFEKREPDIISVDTTPVGVIPAMENPKTKKTITSSTEYEDIYSAALKELNLKNYEGASKLFMKVLEIKPTHKASIIRLKQCEEAMHNA